MCTKRLQKLGKRAGRKGTNGQLEFPKASTVRFDGNSVHFLHEPGSERVKYTWTLIEEAS